MTFTTADSAPRLAYQYRNPVFECDGARMRAQCRQMATVVTISGDIDGNNVDRVIQYVQRFVLTDKPFVLDLSNVSAFSSQGMLLLQAVDEVCRVAGMGWCVIAGHPVNSVLRTFGDQAAFATADSLPEALHHFLDVMLERRRLLLPLFNKTA